jgi:hypothetical protein
MKLNRAELRKIIYDFNSISNRLLQADFNDYSNVVSKFVFFIKNTPIIFDYITDCGPCEQEMKREFDEISRAYGECIFSLGITDEEEVRNVFAIMNYISENDIEIHYGIAMGYSSSTKYQDKIKGFNDRVVMVLIRHIESFLTKIGIDMGIDEKIIYSITVQNGQVNIANDNAKITATNTVGIDAAKLVEVLQAVRITANGLSREEAEIMESNLEVIEEEIKTGKPRKGFLVTAVSGLKMLKGTAEFAAAVAALVQFVQPLIK